MRSVQSSPRAVRWLLLLAVVPLMLALWQYQRGQARSAQLAVYEQATLAPRLPLLQVWQTQQPQGQPVWLMINAQRPSVRIANALLHGQPGVREWQPVQLAGGQWVVLDRGWLARPAAMVQQPLPVGHVDGRWVVRPTPFLLDGARVGVSGDVDALDWAALAASLPGPLLPGLVVMDPVQRPYTPWPTRPPFDPQRHYAYAVQWLLLAACIVLLAWRAGRRKNANASS